MAKAIDRGLENREIVLGVLTEVLDKGNFVHLVLNQALSKYQYLEKPDRAFITRVTEGTLEYLLQIDYIINSYSKTKTEKMKPLIRNILRMSVYQLLYMDRVPDSAVCNEAVKLAIHHHFQGLKGFVNGVLRTIARNKEDLDLSSPYLRYSLPQWMYSMWEKDWGKENAEKIAESFLKERPVWVRCNFNLASKEEILKELEWLKGRYHKAVVQGRNRTCFSLVLETEPFYVAAVRDAYGRDLDEIITDVPKIREMILGYLEEISPELKEKLRFYQDKLLPLYKLYRVETALDAIQKEKVWLNSGGFLVIQQTEAFVSIDVNSGKYTGKKKMEETFRKINLEAAAEIGRQLRLRNLSGIILIDFINMENPDHRDELFHVLQKLLRKDPVKSRAIDITPLHILEMTRKKVRRPVIEDIRELTKK